MAPFVPLLAGAQVELLYILGGVVIENRLWFVYDNPPYGSTELQGLSDGVYAWHAGEVMPYLSHELQLAAVVATNWTTNPTPFFTISGPPINGGSTDKSYSANVAVLVPFRWPLGYRERRNANYVPGIPDSAVTLNTVDLTFSDHLFDAYVNLIDEARRFYPIENWRWVNTSAWDAGVLRSTQLWGDVEGPSFVRPFKLGQRRRRLPRP